MDVVIRRYSGAGAKELFDLLEKNKPDIEKILGTVEGLVSYTLARTDDGGLSVTVCKDQAGIDESTQKAREWIAKNAAHIKAASPQLSTAAVIAHL